METRRDDEMGWVGSSTQEIKDQIYAKSGSCIHQHDGLLTGLN